MSDLYTILSEELDISLAKKIVDLFEGIQMSYRLQDFMKLGQEAGLFCEGILMALWRLYNRTTFNITGLNFGNYNVRLQNSPSYSIDPSKDLDDENRRVIRDESIRLYIPRTLDSIYTLRNKKQVAHLRGVAIDYLDALLIVQACSWTVSEILSVIANRPDDETLMMIYSIGKMQFPLFEWIQGEIALKKKKISEVQGLLLILLASGGQAKHEEAMKILRDNYPNLRKNREYAIRNLAIENEWVHRSKSNILTIREEGWNELSRIAAK